MKVFKNILSFVLILCIGFSVARISAPRSSAQTSLPAGYNSELKVLMIGNSFCYYFLDELVGLGKSEGIYITAGRMYKSGCRLHEHWDWLVNNHGGYDYAVFTPDKAGDKTVKSCILDKALSDKSWDVLTIQQHFTPSVGQDKTAALASFYPYVTNLTMYLENRFPDAKLYMHQIWSFQVGYSASTGQVKSVEEQTKMYEGMKAAFAEAAKYLEMDIIPSGDAWQLARANPKIRDNLCRDDKFHDGEIGGQYLNACVWFEVLTQKSCIGNTYRPSYAKEQNLTEEKIAILQQCAHDAVAAVYGQDYAK